MEKKFTLVAAFDIGRTRSTYVFGTDGRNTALSEIWINGTNGEIGQTTATTVLLDADEAFHSFGYEADEHFEALTDDHRRKGWRLFSCFSASLQDYKNLDDTSTVTDTDGRPYPALTIFKVAIKYLYKRLLDRVNQHRFGIEQEEIKCVFLVPAIWSNNGKTFMRQAAQLAGIPIPNIGVEFDSEAAVANLSLYANPSLYLQVTNSEHIVLGLHGEKADITLQTMSKGRTKIQHTAVVDDIFNNQHTFDILKTFLGHSILNEFKRNYDRECSNFINDFERKMRLKSSCTKFVNVTMPLSLLEISRSNSDGSSIQQPLPSRLSILFSDLKQWFDKPIDRVISKIRSLLRAKNVQTILLVGKFADSIYVQEKIRTHFPECKVIIPVNPEVAIATGILHMRSYQTFSDVVAGPDGPVVAAFDIGTTYSGYAFSFKDEPTNVFTNPAWYSNGLSSFKTATSILLNSNGLFDSFGFDAEERFSQLVDNENDGWRLFRKFKMILHNNKTLTRETTIEDLYGEPHAAIEIFAMIIKALHGHLFSLLKGQNTTICESDISYLITVPAIWDDSAKQFMREAAIMAGIDGDRLKLALEPEVAALWCKRTILTDRKQDETPAISSKYIVIDVGGGTADVSIHQILPSGEINVIYKPSGGPWGGVCVDEAFLDYLRTTFGTTAIDDFKKNNIGDFFNLITTFETKKRSNMFATDKCNVYLPLSLIDIIRAQHRGTPQISNGKLAVQTKLLKDWFDHPLKALCKHVKEILINNKIDDIRTLFLVGGFGESLYVQKRIKEEFPEINVICPNESSLAVLKGAVLFGRVPDMFKTRVMKYTYGISVYKAYDHTKHYGRKLEKINGQYKIGKCFQIFVHANETVNVKHRITHSTVAVGGTPVIRVYKTSEENPEYTTDPGCELLGILRVPDDEDNRGHKIDVTFIFAETELSVKTKYSSSEKEDLLLLDCL